MTRIKITLYLLFSLISSTALAGQDEYDELLTIYQSLDTLSIELASVELIPGPQGDKGNIGIIGAQGTPGPAGATLTPDDIDNIFGKLAEAEIYLNQASGDTNAHAARIKDIYRVIMALERYASTLEGTTYNALGYDPQWEPGL